MEKLFLAADLKYCVFQCIIHAQLAGEPAAVIRIGQSVEHFYFRIVFFGKIFDSFFEFYMAGGAQSHTAACCLNVVFKSL